jgi:GxxExxY protein
MDILYKVESYEIIGICMEVHRILGKGLLESVYKEAIEYELKKRNIQYIKEQKFKIEYKDIILEHHFFADFVIDNKIILEIKAIESLQDIHVKQTLNYLAISKLKLGLLINFGEDSLKYKRIVL